MLFYQSSDYEDSTAVECLCRTMLFPDSLGRVDDVKHLVRHGTPQWVRLHTSPRILSHPAYTAFSRLLSSLHLPCQQTAGGESDNTFGYFSYSLIPTFIHAAYVLPFFFTYFSQNPPGNKVIMSYPF